MDRDQAVHTTNLLDREERSIADLLHRFRNLVLLGTETATTGGRMASTGQAAYSSLAMAVETRAMVRSAEDLLALTRLLRELWVIGRLRRPGEGEEEARAVADGAVRDVVRLANGLRGTARERMVGGGGGGGGGGGDAGEKDGQAAGSYVTATWDGTRAEDGRPSQQSGPVGGAATGGVSGGSTQPSQTSLAT